MRPEPLRQLIRLYGRRVPVYRRDDSTSGSYGNSLSYTQVSGNGERLIYVSTVTETVDATDAGERQSGRLVAYTPKETDLRVNDRFDHGPKRVEVQAKHGRPNDYDPVVYEYDIDDVAET